MRPLLALLLLLSLAGCAGRDVNENDPKSLLDDAEENIKSDQYQIALDKLRMIKNKFPYSNASVTAQLRIADVYFLQDSFAEAAVSYEAFRDLHPNHERVSYAMFKIAKSHFMDMPSTPQRDLTPAFKAQDAYREFLKRFPKATEAEEAKRDLAQTRDLLAEKEFMIGEFYFKRKFGDSAKPRFQRVLDLYSDTTVAERAKSRLEAIDKAGAR